MIKFSSAIEDYIIKHSEDIPQYLQEISRETHLRSLHPRMLSGPVQGRLLKIFTQMMNPLRVLEIGTFTGYSALCIAEGLNDSAALDTIEIDDELEEFILQNFNKTPHGNKINLIIGDALDEIPKLHNNVYDMVFIDGNKRLYVEYFEAIFPLLKTGGFILADNVLWDGHVVDEHKLHEDPQTIGIHAFNNLVKNDERVECVLLPIRDGIMIVRKK